MKLFEDLMEASAKLADKASKVASEAFEQTKVVAGEAMDKGKKKVNELELKNELSKAYRQLGELYFVMRKTGETNEELLTQYYNNAVEISKKLDLLLTEEVNENLDFTFETAEENEESTAKEFVSEVKEVVDEAVEELKEIFTDKDMEVKLCPSCQAPADNDDAFCRECGASLIDDTTAKDVFSATEVIVK